MRRFNIYLIETSEKRRLNSGKSVLNTMAKIKNMFFNIDLMKDVNSQF